MSERNIVQKKKTPATREGPSKCAGSLAGTKLHPRTVEEENTEFVGKKGQVYHSGRQKYQPVLEKDLKQLFVDLLLGSVEAPSFDDGEEDKNDRGKYRGLDKLVNRHLFKGY